MKRFGQIIKVKEDQLERYKELHANVWPKVLERISDCNIKNYSIFYRDAFLFAYFEYHGNDFERDMKKMAEDPITIEWWKETNPCQETISSANENEWWVNMEEVFHID